ncbi:MAG: hypothetical protein ACJ8R9_15660 [Steroidobacteraceae bacterium]
MAIHLFVFGRPPHGYPRLASFVDPFELELDILAIHTTDARDLWGS